jgi:uncharacterized protein YybS (DUF2232 family)
VWHIKKDDAHETQIILEFVNKRLNHNVKIRLPLVTVLLKNILLFSVLSLILAGIVKLRPLLIDQVLWLAISIILFVLCTSGFVYCSSHNSPIFKFQQD